MKNILILSLSSILLFGCQKDNQQTHENPLFNKITENKEVKDYDDVFKIVLEDFELFTQYEAIDANKMQDDLADFLLIDTQFNVEKNEDVPQNGTIYIRKVLSKKTGQKDAFTTSLVDIHSDRMDSSKKCNTITKKVCDDAVLIETIKSIASEKRDVNINFSRGNCKTLTWTFLDCN